MKTKLKKIDKWDFRKRDQIINEKIRRRESDKQYRKFNQDMKNRSMLIRNYKKVFGIDVIPANKIMV